MLNKRMIFYLWDSRCRLIYNKKIKIYKQSELQAL